MVEVELIGIPADCAKFKSKVVTRNGINPIWYEMYTFQVRFNHIISLHIPLYKY